MMGIPVEGPTYIYGDNQSVLANTTIPDSSLKKKSQSIAYHYVHERVDRDEWRTSYVKTHDNKADLLTIPVEGPTYIYGDNQSVLANTTIPDSTLKKKSQSIAYHYVHERVDRDEWRTSYVKTHDNKADLLTKQLPHGEKRKGFVSNLLHHIFCLSGSVMRK